MLTALSNNRVVNLIDQQQKTQSLQPIKVFPDMFALADFKAQNYSVIFFFCFSRKTGIASACSPSSSTSAT